MSFNATLVVMAAGMGSRFGGLKQMEPVGRNGEALLDFSVYDAKKAGFNKVVFVIKHEIEKEFKAIVGSRVEKVLPVEYVYQEVDKLPEGYTYLNNRKKPWGTGQAILLCRDVVKEPFVVINADDFYGASAYRQIYEQLKADTSRYCMVGFRLANTLTENGHVSRGVCVTENGMLTDIDEVTKIKDCKYTLDDENWIDLSPDTVVSMNMWGLTPDIFDYLDREFRLFLDKNIEEPKTEFYIPLVIGTLVKNGEKEVRVLASEDRWYGVTYKEDKDDVVKAIGKMIDNGQYEGM
ncbi:MAG: NTP transferase domain-containing protein [Clostridia bacterium]|nr:NTP transferase domain-containing protein [Clostridia bacterium]MBR3594048.1 NTP transferase domain-containing protein [Clostridia bacterium]